MVPTTTTAGTASRVQHIIIYNKNLAMMTSASLSSADEWRAAIDMDGYICLTDSGVGLRAEEFAKKGWPRTNLDGLKFLKAHTLDDAVSKPFSTPLLASSHKNLSASSRSMILRFLGPRLEHTCCCIPFPAAYSASLHLTNGNVKLLRSWYGAKDQRSYSTRVRISFLFSLLKVT